MQSSYEARFSREMGCTEPDWLRWLPAAMGAVPWQQEGSSLAATLEAGQLHIGWQVAPDRVIAQVRMPVLKVDFQFTHVEADQRLTFMRRFDLYMHRGGG
jgi:hypothetical protein